MTGNETWTWGKISNNFLFFFIFTKLAKLNDRTIPDNRFWNPRLFIEPAVILLDLSVGHFVFTEHVVCTKFDIYVFIRVQIILINGPEVKKRKIFWWWIIIDYCQTKSDKLIIELKIICSTTVKPVLRGHLWDKEKMALEDRRPLLRGLMQFSMTCQERGDLFNTGDYRYITTCNLLLFSPSFFVTNEVKFD